MPRIQPGLVTPANTSGHQPADKVQNKVGTAWGTPVQQFNGSPKSSFHGAPKESAAAPGFFAKAAAALKLGDYKWQNEGILKPVLQSKCADEGVPFSDGLLARFKQEYQPHSALEVDYMMDEFLNGMKSSKHGQVHDGKGHAMNAGSGVDQKARALKLQTEAARAENIGLDKQGQLLNKVLDRFMAPDDTQRGKYARLILRECSKADDFSEAFMTKVAGQQLAKMTGSEGTPRSRDVQGGRPADGGAAEALAQLTSKTLVMEERAPQHHMANEKQVEDGRAKDIQRLGERLRAGGQWPGGADAGSAQTPDAAARRKKLGLDFDDA